MLFKIIFLNEAQTSGCLLKKRKSSQKLIKKRGKNEKKKTTKIAGFQFGMQTTDEIWRKAYSDIKNGIFGDFPTV